MPRMSVPRAGWSRSPPAPAWPAHCPQPSCSVGWGMAQRPRRPTPPRPRRHALVPPVPVPRIVRIPMSARPPEVQALDRLGWFTAPSWQPWRTAIRALLGDPLTPGDGADTLQLFLACTDRPCWPTRRHTRGWFLVGRRGGKSVAIARLAVALACFTDVRPYLHAGEVATIMVLASDRRQAGIIYKYVLGLLQSDPGLAALIVGE